jgi:hypothetical protein
MTGSIDDPRGIQDLLLLRLSRIVAIGGSMATRICEGQYGTPGASGPYWRWWRRPTR